LQIAGFEFDRLKVRGVSLLTENECFEGLQEIGYSCDDVSNLIGKLHWNQRSSITHQDWVVYKDHKASDLQSSVRRGGRLQKKS